MQLCTFNIRPFATSEAHTPLRPTSEFLKWLTHHPDLMNSAPSHRTPSPAAVAIFSLISSRSCTVSLSPRPPNLSVTVSVPVPSHVPFIIRPACEHLRSILSHVMRFPSASSSPQPLSKCGFVGCDASCLPDASEQQLYRIDAVFRSCTARYPKLPAPPERPKCNFLQLPDDVLLRIVLALDGPSDFNNLAEAHPFLKHFLRAVVPSLRLRLYPHQVSALARMNEMESVKEEPMSLVHRLNVIGYEHLNVVVDLVNGSVLAVEDIPKIRRPRGGLLCDEPGMGKTITALSFILKTMGRKTRGPPDVGIRRFDGTPLRYYEESVSTRFQMYGESRKHPTRIQRLMPDTHIGRSRISSRKVRAPNFFDRGKGVGALPSQDNNNCELRRVYLSPATLIAVPTVLTHHWLNQILTHVESATRPPERQILPYEVSRSHQLSEATKLKILYIRSKHEIPDPRDLATFSGVILVSFQTLADLFKEARSTSPGLLRVHFLRIIVDEGHKLSSSGIQTNFSSVCDRIRADCRWILTGTPTPVTHRSDIDYLHSLISFIRDESFGMDREAWKVGIHDPYSKYRRESLHSLEGLLSRVMIRADKSILRAKCHIKNTFLEFTAEAAESYNGVVHAIERNQLLADWHSEVHKESLFNKSNHEVAREAVSNLRKACAFGGTMDVEFPQPEVAAALDVLYERNDRSGASESDRFVHPVYSLPILQETPEAERDQAAYSRALEGKCRMEELNEKNIPYQSLLRIVPREGSSKEMPQWTVYVGKLQRIGSAFVKNSFHCDRCKSKSSFPIVTPCAHLLCDMCVLVNKARCVAIGCRQKYEMEKTKEGKVVPKDLIELQPAALSQNWKDKWEESDSAKMLYLTERIKKLPLNEEWSPGDSEPQLVRPKVIIHSEFGDHLKWAALCLMKDPELSNAYVEMVVNDRELTDHPRRQKAADYATNAVRKFTSDPNKNILLMNTRHGAVGFDLSFVQYIFLMEPVWDAAVELQIVSRAHRIGCKQDIYVERLVMRGSIEEDISNDLHGSFDESEETTLSGLSQAKAASQYKKVKDLLRNVRLVEAVPAVKAEAEEIEIDIVHAQVGTSNSQESRNLTSSKRRRDPDGGGRPSKSVRFA